MVTGDLHIRLHMEMACMCCSCDLHKQVEVAVVAPLLFLDHCSGQVYC